ncbi:hypothetical protein HY792_04890 [Candidatus Desantisbacteria bacterium]|nr:hypothetical protein [Candidatus Desantisbacteria bacterium]
METVEIENATTALVDYTKEVASSTGILACDPFMRMCKKYRQECLCYFSLRRLYP